MDGEPTRLEDILDKKKETELWNPSMHANIVVALAHFSQKDPAALNYLYWREGADVIDEIPMSDLDIVPEVREEFKYLAENHGQKLFGPHGSRMDDDSGVTLEVMLGAMHTMSSDYEFFSVQGVASMMNISYSSARMFLEHARKRGHISDPVGHVIGKKKTNFYALTEGGKRHADKEFRNFKTISNLVSGMAFEVANALATHDAGGYHVVDSKEDSNFKKAPQIFRPLIARTGKIPAIFGYLHSINPDTYMLTPKQIRKGDDMLFFKDGSLYLNDTENKIASGAKEFMKLNAHYLHRHHRENKYPDSVGVDFVNRWRRTHRTGNFNRSGELSDYKAAMTDRYTIDIHIDPEGANFRFPKELYQGTVFLSRLPITWNNIAKKTI